MNKFGKTAVPVITFAALVLSCAATWVVYDEFFSPFVKGERKLKTVHIDSAASTNTVTEELNGHVYKLFEKSLSWEEAEEYCVSLGGHLVSINSEEEQNLVQSMADESGVDNLWLGGYRDNTNWKWTDGSDFWTYTNFDDGKPDNYTGDEMYTKFPRDDFDYGSWSAHRGKWDDVENEADGKDGDVPLSSFGFICEIVSESDSSDTAGEITDSVSTDSQVAETESAGTGTAETTETAEAGNA